MANVLVWVNGYVLCSCIGGKSIGEDIRRLEYGVHVVRVHILTCLSTRLLGHGR
jgi:hypothetical protein